EGSPRATHLSPRAGAERSPGRGLLPPDRARAVADLFARRHRQPGSWRFLRARRLSGRDARAAHRFRGRVRCLAPAGRADRRRGRAAVLPAFLPLRPDPQPPPHLRPRHGHRAGPAHRLWGRALALLDPAGTARPGSGRRLHLPALPPHHLRHRAGRRRRDLVPGLPHRLRPRGAGRRAGSRHGRRARHLAATLHDRGRGAGRGPRWARRRAARADLGRPPGHGGRNPHRGLRGGGHRRPRLLLGRHHRGRPGRRRARRHDLLLPARRRGLDLPPDGARPAAAPARPFGRAHPEVRI
ncbi:MAG: High-affinity branched-chain amino acid transport system permease protein LivH, partial [uncultured Microvirga sp.]